MIIVVIYEDDEIITQRAAKHLSDNKFWVHDGATGDSWIIEHNMTSGHNALAKKLLTKPTAGVTRGNV